MCKKIILLFIILILIGFGEAAITPDINVLGGKPQIISGINIPHESYPGISSPIAIMPVSHPVLGTSGAELNGSITIKSSPPGAQIWLDGKELGKVTPLTLREIVPGSHVVLLYRLGYLYYVTGVTVKAGKVSQVHAKLVPGHIPGYLQVNSTPSKARIWLDGGDTGKYTPQVLRAVSPGSHTVTLKLSGYKNYTAKVKVVDRLLSLFRILNG